MILIIPIIRISNSSKTYLYLPPRLYVKFKVGPMTYLSKYRVLLAFLMRPAPVHLGKLISDHGANNYLLDWISVLTLLVR